VCTETIRVTGLEVRPNNSGHVRCAGTIRGAYLHAGTSSRVIAALTNSLESAIMVDVEIVRGAIVKVYTDDHRRAPKQNHQAAKFVHAGTYSWYCTSCWSKVYSVQEPVSCRCKEDGWERH
jgi:hypothetical protein